MFRARPRIVFDAMTKPELIRLSLRRVAWRGAFSCETDLRVGGRYRFAFGRRGQPQMAFSGVYQEIVAGERVVYTQVFEPMPRRQARDWSRRRTRPMGLSPSSSSASIYPSKQVLDGAIRRGWKAECARRSISSQSSCPSIEANTLVAGGAAGETRTPS